MKGKINANFSTDFSPNLAARDFSIIFSPDLVTVQGIPNLKIIPPRCSHPASGHIVAHTHEYPLATKRENCLYKFFPKFGEASSIRNLKISRNPVHSSRSAIASQTPLKIDEEVTISFFQPAHICNINSTESYTTQKLSVRLTDDQVLQIAVNVSIHTGKSSTEWNTKGKGTEWNIKGKGSA
ncbi:Hypothetical predicted protein [Olea europaea subsp. europaea]|uniref:Uncharacterized protein n=1 Tax=Olea europaea subsp. europaea TaxID=158383 RepID=A0A8S0UKS6_OLEEU|nr:Hypothetical predicted protein [Olea europaea subsp. europaea]